MYCLLFCFLLINGAFSQSIEDNRGFQFHKVISQMGEGEILISAGLSYNPSSERVYILKRTKDSFCATGYASTVNNDIGDVYSLLVNNDTLFIKTVDTLYGDIKQGHNYKQYSKEILKGGYFFLTFYANNKLQIFGNSEASKSQLAKIDLIIKRLNSYSVIPFSGRNNHMKYLHIQNWNDLLNYLKTGVVNTLTN